MPKLTSPNMLQGTSLWLCSLDTVGARALPTIVIVRIDVHTRLEGAQIISAPLTTLLWQLDHTASGHHEATLPLTAASNRVF